MIESHNDSFTIRWTRPSYSRTPFASLRTAVIALITAIAVVAPSVGAKAILERTDDPPVRALQWYLVETDHFRIHYTEGLDRIAATLAELGDRIYEPLTSLYGYRPPDKTNIILRDHGDIANGFAAYTQNRVEIWASNLDFEFRSTHDWLRDVFTHEFTHIIQLGASKKTPHWLPQVYFQYFSLEPEYRSDVAEGLPNVLASVAIPTTLIPMWFAEGVAQYQADPVRADWWDPHRDMVLRTAILSGTQLSYRQMEGFYDHDGREAEMVYSHGFAFVRWLAATYGDSALRTLSDEMAKWHTWTFDRALKSLTGKPGRAVYDEWIADLRAHYEQFVDERSPAPAGELIEDLGVPDSIRDATPLIVSPEPAPDPGPQSSPGTLRHQVEQQLSHTHHCSRCAALANRGASIRAGFYISEPAFSPDGSRLAYITTEGQDYHIASVAVKTLESDTVKIAKKSLRASSSVSWFPDGRRVVFSRVMVDRTTQWRYNDLIVADIDDDDAIELTKRWRATYPDVSPDGARIVFVRNDAGSSNLWIVELDTTNLDSSRVRALTHWSDGTQVFSPRWSPDGTRIAVSIARAGQRDVVIMRMPTDESEPVIERVIASSGSDRDPTWSADGSRIVFTSAHDGVFNLFEADLTTNSVQQITNVLGGAFAPDIAPDGRIAYSSYETDGYVIRMVPADHPRTPVDAAIFANTVEPAGTLAPEITRTIEPINRAVPHFMPPAIMPRIGFYDGDFRIGAYGMTGDIWDGALLLGGLWVGPRDFEYDAFLLADLSHERLRWPLSLEALRTVRYTQEDTVISGKLWLDGVRYGLNSVQASLKPRLWLLNFDLHGIYQRYDAEIDQTLRENNTRSYVGYNYTYYKGAALGVTVSQTLFAPFTTRDTNPQGFRWSVRLDRWWNDFFEDFDSNSGLLIEEYTPYTYNQMSLEGTYALGMPWHGEHTLSLDGRAMFIDANVDSFFYEGIGGIIGLRGYTYYQLQGNRTAWSRLTYRFPVPGLTEIDKALGPVYFDKVYLGVFGEAGRVWRDTYANTWVAGVKRDVGVEIRADTFTFYGYPSRIAFTWARALDRQPSTDRQKFLLTVLFGYL